MQIVGLILISIVLVCVLAILFKVFSEKQLLNTIKSDNTLLRQELMDNLLQFMGNLQKNNFEFFDNKFKSFENISDKKIEDIRKLIDDKLEGKLDDKINQLANIQRLAFENQISKLDIIQKSVSTSFSQFETRFKTFESMNEQKLENIRTTIEQRLALLQDENNKKLDEMRKTVDEKLQETLQTKLDIIQKSVSASFLQFETRFKTFESMNEEKLENIRTIIEKRLSYLQEENNRKLDEMRKTVDEKLQETLQTNIDKSFKLVSERLTQVHEGLGEMKNLAIGVGDLKKVLSNVKNRGIVGEVQLKAILDDILTKSQFEENIATKPGSKDRVEFAIKLPAADNTYIYLPIDAKFHGDTFAAVQDAYNVGDKDTIINAKKALANAIKKSASDIRSKYISIPNTTEFAIMFLPFEGLYAEVVNLNLLSELQKERIIIAGPSSMAIILNSFQMGFRMLTLQERSQDVWKLLSEVKSEFGKFEDILLSVQKKLKSADDEVEKLITTRTNVMNRKLRDVESSEVQEIAIESALGIDTD